MNTIIKLCVCAARGGRFLDSEENNEFRSLYVNKIINVANFTLFMQKT